MTRAEATKSIEQAIKTADAAYWAVCDAEERAIDPADLMAPTGLFEATYDLALMIEILIKDRGLTWTEARNLVRRW